MNRFTRWLMVGVFAVGALTSCTDENTQQGATGVEPEFAITLEPGFAYDLIEGSVTPGEEMIGVAKWEFPTPWNVGTGRINPFLSVQHDPREDGWNTDGDWDKKLWDMTRPQYTDALRVSDIPVIIEGGVALREIIFDANEANKDDPDNPQAQFAINKFDLYICNTGDAAPATWVDREFIGNPDCDQIYTFGQWPGPDPAGPKRAAAWDAETSGSGQRLDYRITFPADLFGDGECNYAPVGSETCNAYVILDVDMGDDSDDAWKTGSTFEEFSTIKRPQVAISKTADATFDRTYNWVVDKVADPILHQLQPDGSGTSTYTVEVKLDPDEPYTDSNFALSGVITITNPSTKEWKEPAQVDAVYDDLPDGTTLATDTDPASLHCFDSKANEVSFPYLLGYGEEITCPYSADLAGELAPGAVNGARVAISDPNEDATGLPEQETEQLIALSSTPENVTNATVTVKDIYEGGDPAVLGTASYDESPKTFTYTRTWHFTIPTQEAVCKLHPNTAYVYGDEGALLDSDDAEVLVQCTNLDVSKSVFTSVDRKWNWTLTKSAAPDWDLFVGESATSGYEVAVDRVDYTESNWTVYGVITIVNSGTVAAPIASVSDALTPGGAATVENCEVDATPVTFAYDLAVGATMTCDYSLVLGSGVDRVNVGTANLTGGGSFSSSGEAVSFADEDLDDIDYTDASVTVSDNFDEGGDVELGTVTDDHTWPYTHEFTCGESDVYPNTAKMVGSDSGLLDEKSASVTVNCYDLEVLKTADEFFDRIWTWDIEKDFTDDFLGETSYLDCEPWPDHDNDLICTATLGTGGILTAQYEVTVTADATDTNWRVTGDVTITNNHPSRAADLTQVVDDVLEYSPDPALNCGGATSVPADDGGTNYIVCTYSIGPIEGSPDSNPLNGKTNKATATQQLYDFSYLTPTVGTPDGTKDYFDEEVFTFGSTPATETDKCVDVDDILEGFDDVDFGEICATSDPFEHTFDPYLREFAAPDDCDKTLINMATVYNKDGVALAYDQEQLVIKCEGGCTLTQGYYKTHSEYGPAPYDFILWGLVYPPDPYDEADEELFGSGATWYEVFWMAPSGGNLWIKLAHQWMAAWINDQANGGSPVHQQVLDAADILADYSDGMDIPKDDPNWSIANDLHSDLASYNEGKAGVEHCTEASLLWYQLIYGG